MKGLQNLMFHQLFSQPINQILCFSVLYSHGQVNGKQYFTPIKKKSLYSPRMLPECASSFVLLLVKTSVSLLYCAPQRIKNLLLLVTGVGAVTSYITLAHLLAIPSDGQGQNLDSESILPFPQPDPQVVCFPPLSWHTP